MQIVTLRSNVNLLDKSDDELRQIARFHARYPESATDTRVFVVEMILEARLHRAAGLNRHAERYEAQVFEVLFFTSEEIHNAGNGEPKFVNGVEMYSEAAL